MKYMTDASHAHLAKKLREKGLDCETVHKILRGNEHSQDSIEDGEIAAFLRKNRGTVTLIVSDKEFSYHLKYDDLPHITLWDAVAEYIFKSKGPFFFF